MSIPKVQMVIELTPTWVEVLPILIDAIEHNASSRNTAKVELQRMARLADAYAYGEAVKQIAQYEKVIANIEAVIEAARYEAA